MEQPSICKFREPPSIVNVYGLQRWEDHQDRAGGGWNPPGRSIFQAEARVPPRGVPVDLDGR